MSNEFFVWRAGLMKDGICKLKEITGVPKSFEIGDGVSRLAGWPDDAAAAMDPQFPKDIGLADSLYGAIFVVISGKTRSVLEAEGGGRVEFLPIKIYNHKGRLAAEDYCIVNPLDVVDCIDEPASKAVRARLDPDAIKSCQGLVLRADAVPAEISIFRPAHWKSRIIVRRSLAAKMKTAGLTALRLMDLDEYTGLV